MSYLFYYTALCQMAFKDVKTREISVTINVDLQLLDSQLVNYLYL